MPYKNICWIKLEIALFQDYRFSDSLNDEQKLLFIGLLVLGGSCKNKIPNNSKYIKRQMAIEQAEENIDKNIKHICNVFDKIKLNDGFLSWDNFEKNHNYIFKETDGNSQGTPKEQKGLCQKKKKNKNKKENKNTNTTTKQFIKPTKEELTQYITENGYSVDPDTFLDHYIANGWKVGKAGNAMKDWQATVRTWNKNRLKYSNEPDTKLKKGFM